MYIPMSTTSGRSVASSSRRGRGRRHNDDESSDGRRCESTLYQLRELVDVEAGERMLRSRGFAALRADNEHWALQIENTVSLAKTLGGYVPVRYYLHEAQEGFGRLKAQVMVEGLQPVPYVRMMRDARAVLAARSYWDCDMQNCQPMLLAQTLAHHGLRCPLLDGYNSRREECIQEVMTACSVTRDDAKRLFIRLLFFGGVPGWLEEHPHVAPAAVPAWIHDLRKELRQAAMQLMQLPTLAQLKEFHAKRSLAATATASQPRQPSASVSASTDPVASIMAMFLQTLECKCLCALVRALQQDCRALGGLIYDGVHIEKAPGEQDGLPADLLRRWETAVKVETGFSVCLTVKPFQPSPEWLLPLDNTAASSSSLTSTSASDPTTQPSQSAQSVQEEAWMDGRQLLKYHEMKKLWEKHTFKVINPGNYIREDPVTGTRCVMTDKLLMSMYMHLSYAEVKVHDSGRVTVTASHPFISHWIRDPQIRTYREMVFLPPPAPAPYGVYNLWDGFEVQKYVPSPNSDPDPDSPAVRFFLDFVDTLCNHDPECTKYLLDWAAQIFQEPGRKTGVAVLLKGLEGCGKNRFTDLLRAMMGSKRFLQTANPASTLYGRFTRPREGRMLIVINEAKGSDSFAASDMIKDMITCDEFQCEGKGTNSYTMNCFARFIFTTNNDNCLKVSPDNRRFVVLEVSSALKGNTDYFQRLSALIDDPQARHEFYLHLMARDIRNVDWINRRPITDSFLQMVDLNLPYEHQFFKQMVLERRRQQCPQTQQQAAQPFKISSEQLMKEFLAWLASTSSRYDTNSLKFGHKVKKLVYDPLRRTGFMGMSKARQGGGVVYRLDLCAIAEEMVQQKWATHEDLI